MKGDFDRAKKLMKYDPVGITTFHIHQSSLLRTKNKKTPALHPLIFSTVRHPFAPGPAQLVLLPLLLCVAAGG